MRLRTPTPGSFLRAGLAIVPIMTVISTARVDAAVDLSLEPFLDRWMYPFNQESGSRDESATFGTIDDERFDDRDGQMIIGFDTSAEVTPGLGSDGYDVLSARLTVQISQDLKFIYDDTPDSYTTYLDPEDPSFEPDADPGQAIELFGTGFRNGFNVLTFEEDTPYSFQGPFGEGIRNAHALGYDEDGTPIDVSQSILERFDPEPWAVGMIPGIDPGDWVPVDSQVVFEIAVADPEIQAYLRAALDLGVVELTVTSLTVVEQEGGDFPSYYNREHPLVQLDLASPGILEMEVEITASCDGDIDGNGAVDFDDLLRILGAWGPCEGCPEDIDGNDMVDFDDLLIVLAAWGVCQ